MEQASELTGGDRRVFPDDAGDGDDDATDAHVVA